MEAKIFTNIMDIASCDEKTVDFFSFVTSSRSLLVIKSLIVIFMFLHVLRITIWRIQQKQLRSKRIFFISHCCNFASVIKSIFAQINYTQFICWKALKNWKKTPRNNEQQEETWKFHLWTKNLYFSTRSVFFKCFFYRASSHCKLPPWGF